jgi:hypothetical protein
MIFNCVEFAETIFFKLISQNIPTQPSPFGMYGVVDEAPSASATVAAFADADIDHVFQTVGSPGLEIEIVTAETVIAAVIAHATMTVGSEYEFISFLLCWSMKVRVRS